MQSCSCVKGVFDFRLDSCDVDRFFYMDLSEWMLDEQYVLPENYTVKILPPNRTEAIDVQVNPLSTTKVSAADLGLKTLIDGIYCFTLTKDNGGCGKEYKRSKALFPKIQCCLSKAFSTADDEMYNSLKEVEKFLIYAKNDSELGKVKSAADNYKIANKKLERLKCDCNC